MRLKHLLGLVLLLISSICHSQQIKKQLPTPNGPIYASHVDGNTLYIGGNFSQFSQQASSFAQANTSNLENLGNWPLFTNSSNLPANIYTIITDGADGWYVGGDFAFVNGLPKTNLVHILSNGNLDATFSPTIDGPVKTALLSGTNLFIGGEFNEVNGQMQRKLATLIASTGALSGIQPAAPLETFDYVNTINRDANYLYVGGSFEYLGGAKGAAGIISASTERLVKSLYPEITGTIHAAEPDGAGGWYLGGWFTTGHATHNHLIRVNSSGEIDLSFNPEVDNVVNALRLLDGKLYVGGSFFSVNGSTRQGLVALNPNTGATIGTGQVPVLDGAVYTIDHDDNKIYFGGGFTVVGGQNRNYAAAINRSNAALETWNPDAGSLVNHIQVRAEGVYLAGNFFTLGGESQKLIGRVNNTTGAKAIFNVFLPDDAASHVNTLLFDGNLIYVGGSFSELRGQVRNNFAVFNQTTQTVTSLHPTLNQQVYSLCKIGNDLFIGGSFENVSFPVTRGLLKVDLTTGFEQGRKTDFTSPFATIYVLKETEGNLLLGGVMGKYGGYARTNLAAVSPVVGSASEWRPNPDGVVHALLIDGSDLFVGGAFLNISSTSKPYVAKYNTGTLALSSYTTPFSDTWGATITAIAKDGNKLYVGGNFLDGFHAPRSYLMEIHATTGAIQPFNPVLDNYPLSLQIANNRLFVGGYFSNINSQSRVGLAVFESNGTLSTQTNNFNSTVTTLGITSTKVAIGGPFSQASIRFRGNVAAIDLTTGNLLPFNPSANSQVMAIKTAGDYVFIGGNFTDVNSVANSSYAVRVHKTNGTVLGLNADNHVNAIETNSDGTIAYFGGVFNNFLGGSRSYLAAVNVNAGTLNAINLGANWFVTALKRFNNDLYVGGAFSQLGGQNRSGLGAINLGTSSLTTFSSSLTLNNVGALEADANHLYVANSGSLHKLLRADATQVGSALQTQFGFQYIRALALNSSTLFVGGEFTELGGNNLTALAEVPLGVGQMTVSTTNYQIPSGSIFALNAKGSNELLASGNFTEVLGTATSSLAYLETGAIPAPIISSFTPEFGFTGQTITLIGSNFSSVTSVKFGGVEASSFNIVNDGEITAVIGAGASGSVSATNGGGTGSKSGFTYCNQPTPSIAASGPTTFCQGNSVILTASPDGYEYLWSNGQTTRQITVTEAGNYTVRIVSGVCQSPVSNQINVSITPGPAQPTVSVIGNAAICADAGVTLSAPEGFEQYVWESGQSTRQILVTAPGYYRVRVAGPDGCFSVYAEAVYVENITPATPSISVHTGSLTGCTSEELVLKAPDGYSSYLWSNGANTQQITVSANGTYTVTGTIAGCTSLPSAEVIVNRTPAPAAPTIATPFGTVICGGNPVTISGPEGFDVYLWSDGSGGRDLTTSTPGAYTLRVGSGDCLSPVSASVTLTTLGALPQLSIAPSVSPVDETIYICEGGSVNLTATDGYQYIWSNGATTRTISATESGTYWVKAVAGSCEGPQSEAVNVQVLIIPSPLTGLPENYKDSICVGETITLSYSENPPYQYLWNNSITGNTFNVSAGGMINVKVIDPRANCASTAFEFEIKQRPAAQSVPLASPTILTPSAASALAQVVDEFYVGWTFVQRARQYNIYIYQASESRPSTPLYTYFGNSGVPNVNLSHLTAGLPQSTLLSLDVEAVGPCGSTFSTRNISFSSLPDLKIEIIDAPISVNAGETYTLTYKVTNVGAGHTGRRWWKDYIYINVDKSDLRPTTEVEDESNIYKLGEFVNPTALAANESYTVTRSFKVPKGAGGNYFFWLNTNVWISTCENVNLVTDTCRQVGARYNLEGDLIEADDFLAAQVLRRKNNIAHQAVFVNGLPKPFLKVVSHGAIPPVIFSGQNFFVQYTIKNIGQGTAEPRTFWPVRQPCDSRINSGGGVVIIPNYSEYGYFSSHYYISHLPVLNTDSARLLGTDIIMPRAARNRPNEIIDLGGFCGRNPDWSIEDDYIKKDSSLDFTLTTRIPSLASGQYYIHIIPNTNNGIINHMPLDGSIVIPVQVIAPPHPDFRAKNLSVLNPSMVNGDTVSVNIRFDNIGSRVVKREFDSPLIDSVYLTSGPNLTSSSVIQAYDTYYDIPFEDSILVNVERSHTFGPFLLPDSVWGSNHHLHYVINPKERVFESGKLSNNTIKIPVSINATGYPDLVVERISAPAILPIGSQRAVQVRVGNIGERPVTRDFFINIYARSHTDPTIEILIYSQLAGVNRLAAGTNRNFIINIQPIGAEGMYDLYSEINPNRTVKENGRYTNNYGFNIGVKTPVEFKNAIDVGGGTVVLDPTTAADIQALSVGFEGQLNSRRTITIKGRSKNLGLNRTLSPFFYNFYLTTTPTELSSGFLLKSVVSSGTLEFAAEEERVTTVRLPDNVLPGNYHLVLEIGGVINELPSQLGNNRVSIPVIVEPTSAPDFVITSLAGPADAQIGQIVTFNYSLQNIGNATAFTDGMVNSIELRLAYANATQSGSELIRLPVNLGIGQTFNGTAQIALNANAVGPCKVELFVNESRAIFEESFENNASSPTYINLVSAPLVELTYATSGFPANTKVNDPVSFNYSITNTSGANLTLRPHDFAKFLTNPSASEILAINTKTSNLQIPAGQSVNGTLEFMPPILKEGSYDWYLRGNSNRLIRESDYENNTVLLANRQLTYHLLQPNETYTQYTGGGARYFKISPPAGKDVIIRARPYRFFDDFPGPDVPVEGLGGMPWEMIATCSQDWPNGTKVGDFYNGLNNVYGNYLVIPNAQCASYIIRHRSTSPVMIPPFFWVDYSVQYLDFSIIRLSRDSLGKGKTTLAVLGAGFKPNMVFQLLDAGNNVVATSTQVILLNSMNATVKWDLTSVPVGRYSLRAVNPDNETAIKENAIVVAEPQSKRVILTVNAPPELRRGRVGNYRFTFKNEGNVDIDAFVAQVLTYEHRFKINKVSIIEGRGIKMSDFNRPGVANYPDIAYVGDSGAVVPITIRQMVPDQKLVFELEVAVNPAFDLTGIPMRVTGNAYSGWRFAMNYYHYAETFRKGIIEAPRDVLGESLSDPNFSGTELGQVAALAGNREVFYQEALAPLYEIGLLRPEDTHGVDLSTDQGMGYSVLAFREMYNEQNPNRPACLTCAQPFEDNNYEDDGEDDVEDGVEPVVPGNNLTNDECAAIRSAVSNLLGVGADKIMEGLIARMLGDGRFARFVRVNNIRSTTAGLANAVAQSLGAYFLANPTLANDPVAKSRMEFLLQGINVTLNLVGDIETTRSSAIIGVASYAKDMVFGLYALSTRFNRYLTALDVADGNEVLSEREQIEDGITERNLQDANDREGNILTVFFNMATSSICTPVVNSRDPNDIVGPSGYGPLKMVSKNQALSYRVNFENDSNIATAAAQVVSIKVKIPEKFDISSFRLGQVGFNNMAFGSAVGEINTFQSLNLPSNLPYNVNLLAGINPDTREIIFNLSTIEKSSGLPPNSSLGLLPINNAKGDGEGYFEFTISPSAASITGDSLALQAEIIFDDNEVIPTNTWVNYVDAGAPNTRLVPVDTIMPERFTIPLTIANDDAGGSGLRSVQLWVSTNDGPYLLQSTYAITETPLFVGAPNNRYCVVSVGTDFVGNTEAFKPQNAVCFRTSNFSGNALVKINGRDSVCTGTSLNLESYSYGDTLWVLGYTDNPSIADLRIIDTLSSEEIINWVLPDSVGAGEYYLHLRSLNFESIVSVPLKFVVLDKPQLEVGFNSASGSLELCPNISDSLLLFSQNPQNVSQFYWKKGADIIHQDTVIIRSAGEVKLMFFNAAGCADSIPVQINHRPLGAKPTIIGDTIACAVDGINLSSGSEPSGTTYAWEVLNASGAILQTSTSEDIQINNPMAKRVRLKVTRPSECVSDTASEALELVQVLPEGLTAKAPVIKSVCLASPDTLKAVSGFEYEWNTGATSRTIEVSSSGTYWVKYKLGDCIAQRIDSFIITSAPCALVWNGSVSREWEDERNWTPNATPTSADSVIINSSPNDPLIGSPAVVNVLRVNTAQPIEVLEGFALRVNKRLLIATTTEANLLGAYILGDGNSIAEKTIQLLGHLNLLSSGSVESSGLTIDAASGGLAKVETTNKQIRVSTSIRVLTGTFDLNGKTLVLQSTESVRGILGRMGSDANIINAQNFTFRQYLNPASANGSGAWFMVGTPLKDQVISNWAKNNTFAAHTYSSAQPANSSVWFYDATNNNIPANKGYIKPLAPSQNVGAGIGARIWFWRNSFFNGNATIELKGQPNYGNFTFSNLKYCESNCPYDISQGGLADNGWNLVANPYAATIDWDSPSWIKNSLHNSLHIYDFRNQRFSAYVNGVGVNGGSNLIAPGQGFFIRASAPAPMLVANENVKSTERLSVLRQGAMTNLLKVTLKKDSLEEETALRILDDATQGFDRNFDALNMVAEGIDIATENQSGTQFAIDTRNLPSRIDTFQLVIRTTEGLNTLNFGNVSSFESSIGLNLIDKQTAQVYAITDGFNHTFLNNQQGVSRRFAIVLSNNASGISYQSGNDWGIYPNPATTTFQVYWADDLTNNRSIKITNAIGKEVLNSQVGNREAVSISSLPKGYYQVEIQGLGTKKLIVR